MRLTRWPGLQLVRNHVDAFERSVVRIGSRGRSHREKGETLMSRNEVYKRMLV